MVLLRENEGQGRLLPIYIGTPEAQAIIQAMKGLPTARPYTHDLMRDLLVTLGATLERVVVTDLRDGIYFAEMHLLVGTRLHEISCRPSDAIAIAARTDAPIFMAERLLDKDGIIPRMLTVEGEDEEEEEELVDEFRHFIEGIRPEDFSS
ncbi:MAG TPA: bifunctional nuclease family protein [Acidimicrobiales bacterium]|nr:bifunctional nuclease family protein [Acidimicrobiales bacterium]